MNILLVDDNSNNRMILKLLLDDYSEENKIKFNIDEAGDGVTAVKKCKDKTYDIIFMDIVLPNIDGIEATKIIRDMQKEVMIIAVSAIDDTIKQREILSSGAEDYISKPINSDIFVSRISNYITLVKARSHVRRNEYYVNLFTKAVYSRNTKFMIHSEDSISEFWEFFLLNITLKYDGLSDIVRTLFSIADAQLRFSIESGIYIEESDEKQYFTIINIKKLPSKVLELILNKNPITSEYRIMDNKISFELKKICSIETSDLDTFNESSQLSKIVEVSSNDNEIKQTIMPLNIQSKELVVFDYMDSDDLIDLEEYAGLLSSLMLIAGTGDITKEEVQEIYTYLEKISSVLNTYSEIYPISKALSLLSNDMSKYIEVFIQNSEALGPMCNAFSNDMSSWIKMSFYTGAPSIEFMNDTIVVNCQTISSMLKINDEPVACDDLDDIFDF